MADPNPTHGRRTVPLDLPALQTAILRDRLTGWLGGIRDEESIPAYLDSLDAARREAEAYERLLAGIEAGAITVPDQEARAFLSLAARAADRATGYEQVAAEHDALHALLSILGQERP